MLSIDTIKEVFDQAVEVNEGCLLRALATNTGTVLYSTNAEARIQAMIYALLGATARIQQPDARWLGIETAAERLALAPCREYVILVSGSRPWGALEHQVLKLATNMAARLDAEDCEAVSQD